MDFQQIQYGPWGIASLRDNHQTEYILPGEAFGPLSLKYLARTEKEISCQSLHDSQIHFDSGQNAYTITVPEEISLTWQFVPKGDSLAYRIYIQNLTGMDMEIRDLSIRFPMNTRFEWNTDACQKVIRHSHIAGHNSYLFFQRVNGQPPYLLVTPAPGTGLEYYDLQRKAENDATEDKQYECYRAYIHAHAQEKIAREKGCRWRQPVSRAVLPARGRLLYAFDLQWAEDYEDIRRKIVARGLIDIRAIPGLTIPTDMEGRFCLQTNGAIQHVEAEYPGETSLLLLERKAGRYIYSVRFERLGENRLTIAYNENQSTLLEFFVTEPVETLIQKRGAFIAGHQFKNPQLWYDGLLAEWNNETRKMLGPDDYDGITGWRIYEVTCDDPGLSKPAFLASKNAVSPVQEEVSALDYYIDRFVWGGLQCTDDSEYAYGLYGIPDWRQNRSSPDKGVYGQRHIWRIYDYPHIALMYFGMYRIARDYPFIHTLLTKEAYLERAYRTAVAMFTIPQELIGWSATKTGLYNELVLENIFTELADKGQQEKADRLRHLWERKVHYFVSECKDIFGSEYPFDTTGFESTHVFAKYAINNGLSLYRPRDYQADAFMERARTFRQNQMNCNIACRGYLEHSYYLYGSDIRGNNAFYTLSYMSQMGAAGVGEAFYDTVCRNQDYLRLGYGSLLSSWALMNTGTEETGYGYWAKGAESDGAAGGGFEPAPFGLTWLDQPHHRGSWYYSCEIDLGFCGYLRNAYTLFLHDDIFGWYCYGGDYQAQEQGLENEKGYCIQMKDGVYQRFHMVDGNQYIQVHCHSGRMTPDSLWVSRDMRTLSFSMDTQNSPQANISFRSSFAIDQIMLGQKLLVLHHNQVHFAAGDGENRLTVYFCSKAE